MTDTAVPAVRPKRQRSRSPSGNGKKFPMKLSQSKYATQKAEPNAWKDMTISEANMTAAIGQFMQQMSIVPKTKDVERIIVGDLANGLYPLAVLMRGRD